MKIIRVLDRRGTWGILIALSQKEKLMIRELLEEISVGQKAAYNAVDGLIQIGLVREEREKYHNRRWLMLTEKGRVVASKLNEALQSMCQE